MTGILVRRLLLLGVGLVLFSVVGLGAVAWRARQAALDSREQLSALRQAAAPPTAAPAPVGSGPTRLEGAAEPAPAEPALTARPMLETVRETCLRAGELERNLGPMTDLASAAAPVSQLIGQLPQVGGQAAAMLTLGQAAGEVSAALRLACGALEPTLAPGVTPTASSVLERLAVARDQTREAVGRLRTAQAQLAQVDERELDDSTRRLVAEVRDRLPQATARLALLAELPGLLGYDGPRTFLILGQNNDEIRATGGFIGTSGVVTFDAGRVTRREYGTSARYNVPRDRHVPPPEPIRRDLGGTYWHLRSSNWWPDFPSSAQQARYFWGVRSEEPLAGVIALDQDLIELLLGAVGPVELPEYGERLTAENVRKRLDYHVHEAGTSGESERKSVTSAFFGAVTDRLSEMPADGLRPLVDAMVRGLDEQHLLLWAEDGGAQRAIAELGWDGRMQATSGDYLFPVSVNVGANKVNRDVEQELEYNVGQDESGRLVGRAMLRLRNHRAPNDLGPYTSADYRDYLRVFVPAESELLSTTGFESEPRTDADCGRAVFSGLLTVPPGQERRVELSYRLPATLLPSEYTLVIQKQPGTVPFPLRLRTDGPLGAVGIDTVANGHQLFRVADGQLQSTGRGSVAGASEPACQTYTEPPFVIRAPSELRIPKLGVKAPFVPLGVQPDGTLEAPSTGDVVAWYHQSARPGQVGNMVASGHLDWARQAAVFWRLRELGPGDRLDVVAEDGARHQYEVEWVKQFDPVKAPLEELVGPSSERLLTLITCGGTFNQMTRDYSERTVVRAKLVGGG